MRCQTIKYSKEKNAQGKAFFRCCCYRFHLLVRFAGISVMVDFDGKNIFPISFRLVFIDFCIEIANGSTANAQTLMPFALFSLSKEPVSGFDDLRSDGIFFHRLRMDVCERLIKVDKQKFRFIIGTTCRQIDRSTGDSKSGRAKKSNNQFQIQTDLISSLFSFYSSGLNGQ